VTGTRELHDQAVVALGGGHGLHASLSALRHVVRDPTAVVTVADNGGSSGRLRGEFGVLPPGDLRMALAALCGDDEWGRTWEKVVQHRFAGHGEMRGHVVGNLLIVSLWEQLDDHVQALDWMGRLLGASGRVLPMALTPMDITGTIRGLDPAHPDELTTVRGQVEVASSDGEIVSVQLDPADPRACPEAVAAVREADWVVLNLEAQHGETGGYAPEDHLAALLEHAPELKVHTVLVDRGSVAGFDQLEQAVASYGAHLVVGDVAHGDGTPRHDPVKLANAYEDIFTRG
jgi:2-phospho-L-lactate transferase/gluconeogenesis factor (CofD/UPF0052 family)